MPALTLKNIPDDLHARLKASAARNRRSVNSEILARLEEHLEKPALDPAQYAASLKTFTSRLPRVLHQRTARYKRQGRA